MGDDQALHGARYHERNEGAATSDPFISAYSSTLSLVNDYKDSAVYAPKGKRWEDD